jgi:hypothetical protein
MSLFKECWDRLRRAEAHRTAFMQHWNTLIEENSHRTEGQIDPNGTGIIRVIRNTTFDAGEMPLELGEFFYQLRAALDGAMYKAVVKVTGTDPPANENQLYFPIYTNAATFKDRALYFEPLPDELRFWLGDIQPYNAVKMENTPLVGINAILRLLNDCARKDRHRRLHVVAAVACEASGTVRLDPPCQVISVEAIPANLLDDECQIMRLRIAGFSPATRIDVDGVLRVEISVSEIPGVVGARLDRVLRNLHSAAGIIIEKFEKAIV